MNRKRLLRGLCITAAFLIFISLGTAWFMQKSRTTQPADNEITGTAATITDISSYHKKIALDMNANLPPAEVLNMGGNGLQLYDTDGNFINGDSTLDGTGSFTAFLRVVWLENYASDCSLILLADNYVQDFLVDDAQESTELLDLRMQPKSSVSIPITVRVKGDSAVKNSTLTFLLLSYDIKKSDSGEGDNDQYPNSTNSLSYKINIDCNNSDYNNRYCTKEYSADTTAASNYIEQNSSNKDYINSKAFYSVLSSTQNSNFMFYREKPTIQISNNDFSFYAMGTSKGLSFMFVGDRLVNIFDGKPYLSYSLNDKTYVKQKVTFDLSGITDGERLAIINIQQSSPLYYSVVCHKLSLNN